MLQQAVDLAAGCGGTPHLTRALQRRRLVARKRPMALIRPQLRQSCAACHDLQRSVLQVLGLAAE